MEGDNISIYKACIKNTNSLKDSTLSFLFNKSKRLDLGPISSFLFILTVIESF
jgi:hypothetical protein